MKIEKKKNKLDKVIKLKMSTIEEIEKYREHQRETWDDLVNKIIKHRRLK